MKKKNCFEVAVPAREIRKRVNELGKLISKHYTGKNLVLVIVLKGAVVFYADLIRSLTIPFEDDFIEISSYGSGRQPGKINLIKDISVDVAGKDVLVIEDCAETCRTLDFLLGHLEEKGAKSVRICVVVKKVGAAKKEVPLFYIGFDLQNRFVRGYGMDDGGEGRGDKDISYTN